MKRSTWLWWMVCVGALVAAVGLASLNWAQARGDRSPAKSRGSRSVDDEDHEKEVSLDEVPDAVKATILKEAGGNKIKEIEEVGRGKKKLYEAAWITGGKEVEILVAPNGKLLKKETEEEDEGRDEDDAREGEHEDEGHGETERKVTEAQVPAAALATLKKLAGRATITEFAEEIEHGHTFYEGSWQAPSRGKMDVLVTASGDLVEIEERVTADQVPEAVLKAAGKAAGKGAKLGLEKKTMLLYEVKFRKGNRRHELLLTPDGRLVEEEVEKGKRHRNEDEEEEDDDDDDDHDDDDH